MVAVFNWIDFITSIPIPDAKILRLGRVLRLARLLRVLRLLRFVRVVLLFWRGFESFKELFEVSLTISIGYGESPFDANLKAYNAKQNNIVIIFYFKNINPI